MLPSPRMSSSSGSSPLAGSAQWLPWAERRYSTSLMLNCALIGSTCEIVVMIVDVFTRVPTCAWAMPTMPSIGEVTCVQPWLSCACASVAREDSTVGAAEPVEGADPLAVDRYVSLLDVGDLDGGWWRRRRRGRLVASGDRDQGNERTDSCVHCALRYSRCVSSGRSGRPVSDEVALIDSRQRHPEQDRRNLGAIFSRLDRRRPTSLFLGALATGRTKTAPTALVFLARNSGTQMGGALIKADGVGVRNAIDRERRSLVHRRLRDLRIPGHPAFLDEVPGFLPATSGSA